MAACKPHIAHSCLVATAMLALASAAPVSAKGRYAELVLSFASERPVRYEANEAENSLSLELSATAPEELKALQHYDERLIKRVLITDLGPSGSEVKLYLQDRNVRATLDTLHEPFRLLISLFDKDYAQDRDPTTDLPLAGLGLAQGGEPPPAAGHLLQAPASAAPLVAGSDVLPAAPSAAGMRRLLQPTPEVVRSSDELMALLNAAAEGRGKAWQDYPVYVYPLQIAAFQGRKEPAGWRKKATSAAMASAQAMAEFALHLFSFGHESRALVAYQQVLQRDASIFNKDPLHLWAFAESHFGHGNLTLADGYYQTLITKFPESPLAKLAGIRRHDVQAIRLSTSGQWDKQPSLLPGLARIDTRVSAELRALAAIRQAFWKETAALAAPQVLPLISSDTANILQANLTELESQRTALLAASLILYTAVQPNSPWQIATGELAGEYFTKYSSTTAQPFYEPLKASLEKRLQTLLQELTAAGQYAQTVTTFEALPAILKNVSEAPSVAWALGESYRNIGQEGSALAHYQIAANKAADGLPRFKAYFWTAFLASRQIRRGRQDKIAPGRLATLQRQSREADQRMGRTWQVMKDDEKLAIQTAYKPHLEAAVTEANRLATPPKVILAGWTAALATRLDAPAAGGDFATQYSPSAASIRLLRDLAQRFGELGLAAERRQAIRLMKEVNPSTFSADQEAKRIWSEQLVNLAEEYRKSNEYLEAGRLYTYTAENSTEWEDKAESLYKGGLLLYRAGKREEAIKAFTAASQDGNNLFYANLAKERLTQLLP